MENRDNIPTGGARNLGREILTRPAPRLKNGRLCRGGHFCMCVSAVNLTP